jgi:hypothetical protein
MKLFFSLVFSINICFGSSLVLVQYESESTDAEYYKSVLMNEYNIPEEFIVLYMIDKKCEEAVKKSRLQFCISSSGNLIIVSADERFINETLRTFKVIKEQR